MDLHKMSAPKRLIFERAAELFSAESFETVSLSDIGEAIGKQKSAVYNHFSSKHEILDTIYEYFREHFYDARPTLQELEPIIENGSLADIISSVIFRFPDGEDERRLLTIMRIVYQRKYHDKAAREIAQNIIFNQGIQFAQEVFDHAVALGRLAPFDTHALAVMVNYYRNCIYMRWVLDPTPECLSMLETEEKTAYAHAARLLTDLKK